MVRGKTAELMPDHLALPASSAPHTVRPIPPPARRLPGGYAYEGARLCGIVATPKFGIYRTVRSAPVLVDVWHFGKNSSANRRSRDCWKSVPQHPPGSESPIGVAQRVPLL